ncbi:hypothetical protein Hdeb2414_s0001g00019191 [Helianthus debilis subsp. tardiflorus]
MTCSHVPAWEQTMSVACYLSDPPKGFEMYKSMIVGLNTCRLAHSLRENPVIREDWIKDFWENATAKKGDMVIKSKVQGKEGSICEQDVRETSGVVSVVEGWKYNYSKSVFDDMVANVKTINEKYWYKFSKFVQLILEKKYPKLPITVKTYDIKMMNHLVFTMLNQRSRDNVEIKYQNKQKLEKFGAFAEIQEEAPAQINAIVAEEHDVEIIEAPVGTQEPVENMDLTGVESEEDIANDRMIEDDEVNDDVDETETLAEGLSAETEDVNEPVHLSPPHVEPVTTTETADAYHSREDPTTDLPPRK